MIFIVADFLIYISTLQQSRKSQGNHRIFTASGVDITDNSSYNENVLKLNPFRYRGYYFDEETKLYYLINRYYDPETGRFLSADDVSYLDPETIGGLNLYAYCNNNPVMNIDPEGTFFLTALLIGALVGVVIGGTVAGIKAAEEGLEGWDLVGEVAKGALIGGATGAVGGAGIGLIGAGAAAIGGGSMALIGGATLSGGAAAVAATGAIVVGAGASVASGISTIGLLGQYLFSKIPMHGTPNSTISSNGSTGLYDENGNLIARQDTNGRPHYIKRLGNSFLPHTHIYLWDMIDGAWHIIRKMILPF